MEKRGRRSKGDACTTTRILESLGWLPLLVTVMSSLFYAALFQNWNSALPFRGTVVSDVDASRFNFVVERCRITPSKMEVAGWVAMKGHVRRRHRTTLLMRDAFDGAFYTVKTELPPRHDVAERLNAEFGDRVDYGSSGFSGSLYFRKRAPFVERGRAYAAYDTGAGYHLVELPCTS